VETRANPTQAWRFGVFEVDARAMELRRGGTPVKLREQSFSILVFLLEHAGELVTREDLRRILWPSDTFVDFDHSLNTAVMKLREVLGDSADTPLYIETIPKRGYRFIAPVESGVPASSQAVKEVSPAKLNVWGRPAYYGLALLGTAIIAVGGLAIWKSSARAPGVPRVLRFTKLTNDGQVKVGRMSTDGSRIYFTEALPDGRSLIAQVSVKSGEVIPLPVPFKQAQMLDLSKDGTELLIADYEGGYGQPHALWVQPVAGGSPRRIGTVLAADASFGPDGTSIIYSNEHDVYSVSRGGSVPQKLLTVESVPHSFRFSPDGTVFRFTHLVESTDTVTLMEARADGTDLRKMFGGCCGEWTPNGRFFIFQNKIENRLNLWVLPEDRGRQSGDYRPIELTAGPLDFQYPMPNKDGAELFAIGTTLQSEVVRYDAQSRKFEPYLNGISAEGVTFSADGKWVTYISYPDAALWRSKADGTERLQLTFPPMRVFLPRWSPDGKQIAFNAHMPESPWNIYIISSSGGSAQRILPSDQGQMDANWSADGNSLVFSTDYNHPYIAIVDLRSKRVSPVPGSNELYSPHWSPDGRYISGITNDKRKLVLFDFSTQKWTEVCEGAVHYPTWSHDGKYLYFQLTSPDTNNDRIARLRLSDRRIETVAEIGDLGRLTAGTIGHWFGLAADDSPLLARDISTQEIYALEMEWP
jgi:DNA-binding winged helix-turn-helix (wHTH) protein/Tol biopolymer transport system component